MNTIDLQNTLLEELEYVNAPGFRSSVSWPNGRPIDGITSVYFIQDVPVAYFSQLEEFDATQLLELYRSVWSQGKVPLLYVVLPQEIRVYNSYAEPPDPENGDELDKGDRLLQHLQQLVDIETTRQAIYNKLSDYRRLYLDTGAFWNTPDGQRVKKEHRADQRLLKAMDQVRRKLLNEHLSPDVAYALLGRLIFIRYLEDRGILNKDNWVSQVTHGRVSDYFVALENKSTIYLLFDYLSQRFNGDIFPVEETERQQVTERHLRFLSDFLKGHDLEAGQQSFWPYDFTHIPIELISGIYDTFLSEETRQEAGAYYTPLSLVDFIVEETLPLEKARLSMTVLDPACGSGVFLVRAYQRLIEAWRLQHFDASPSTSQLSTILKECIFGIDIQLNAIRIATFSLCLAMLDYIKNEDIQEGFRFPNLKDTNLIYANFFSVEVDQIFSGKVFDRIIGNPPWGRGTLKGIALEWIERHNYPIGEKQIVQAFLWRVPTFCKIDGEIALLAPAKSTILVTANSHEQFRQDFFNRYRVRAIVNFSSLVYELFPDALSPVVVIFFRPEPADLQKKVVYAIPKPSSISQHIGTIVLDANEVKFLKMEELLLNPQLWKIASWGTPQDFALIKRLATFPPLQNLEKTGQLREDISQGFTVGNKKDKALWLQGMPCVDTNKFTPYVVEAHGIVEESHFERHRKQGIYSGPLTLIRRSACEAAFFNEKNITYHDKITGIAGQSEQEYLLKWLTLYINSSLARYYHFLTSTSWAVERGTIIHDEYKKMPFLVLEKDDPRLQQALYYFDQISSTYHQQDALLSGSKAQVIQQLKNDIDEFVFDIYDLAPSERQLVRDLLEYEVQFFEWSKHKRRSIDDPKAKPVLPPNTPMLTQYAKTFIETATSMLSHRAQTLNATVYQNGAPLTVIEFELVSLAEAKDVHYIAESRALHSLLRKLDLLLLERRTPTLYTRRHVRIYDGSRFYLIHPSERRLWTRSSASTDAATFLTEILVQSRKLITGASH